MGERHQLDTEHTPLEQEQLKLMTTKRDLLQQIDTMKAIEQQKQSMRQQRRTLENKELLKANDNILSLNNRMSSDRECRDRTTPKHHHHHQNANMQRISSELQELKDF